MKKNRPHARLSWLLLPSLLLMNPSFAHEGETHSEATTLISQRSDCLVLMAARVFDGVNFPQENLAVLIEGNQVVQVDTPDQLSAACPYRFDLGDATILPGFIESHAHITFQNVDKNKVLRHGITTVQDTGGALQPIEGGDGSLRLLSVGPIIQAPNGYPSNIFGGSSGYDQIGISVSSTAEAETVVSDLVAGGATAIKISLEPGGEAGAPWMQAHGDQPVPETPWPMLSQEIVDAITAKAHTLGLRVIAHIGENEGARIALQANVDEFAHMPCATIDDELIHQAVQQGVTFVTTIDTLAACSDGIFSNAHAVSHALEHLPDSGAQFIYGSEIGHDNVPWGINGQELHLMLHLTSGESIDFTDVVNVIKSATSKAGERLGIEGLGTLNPGAPADLIAVKGNPFERFKILEYPDLVVSGGHIVANEFNHNLKLDCLFNWAETNYAHLFPAAVAYTQVNGSKIYRNYSSTQHKLGYSSTEDEIYVENAEGQVQNFGSLSMWLNTAECR